MNDETIVQKIARLKTNRQPQQKPATGLAPMFSDDALALEFADRHADDLRYVAAWSHWYSYNGQCWQYDETLKIFDLARKLCRDMAERCTKPKIATGLTSAKLSLPSSDWPKQTGALPPPSSNGTPIHGCSTRQAVSLTCTAVSFVRM
jgi:hypothetical protein